MKTKNVKRQTLGRWSQYCDIRVTLPSKRKVASYLRSKIKKLIKTGQSIPLNIMKFQIFKVKWGIISINAMINLNP